MAKLTVEQVEFLKGFFAERAEILREKAEIDAADADERDMFLSDAEACENVEITDDPKVVYDALGVCDDRDEMVAHLEDEEMGEEIIEIVFDAVVFN